MGRERGAIGLRSHTNNVLGVQLLPQGAPPATLLNGNAVLQKRHVRFGPFELRTDTRELSKLGVRIKLQTKPAQVLEVLVSRPGELVSRQELCRKLWPANVFVDFESGLNTAVNRLRAALGDVAETPHYVETLPRLGYRFICPVEEVDEFDMRPRLSRSSQAQRDGAYNSKMEERNHSTRPRMAIFRDVQFWVPLVVLVIGVALLSLEQ